MSHRKPGRHRPEITDLLASLYLIIIGVYLLVVALVRLAKRLSARRPRPRG